MDWNTVFDGESYTASEVIAKLSEMKLADLSEGEYVSKAKLDRALERAKSAESDLETYKGQLDGDEGLKRQVETLTAQLKSVEAEASGAKNALTRAQRIEAALKLTHDAKLAKLAVLEAESMVDDSTDFDEALGKLVESDPTFVKSEATTTVSTGKETNGQAPSAVSPLMAALQSKLG